MLAIIRTGGKQYLVSEGDTIHIEKLPHAEGASFTFDEVLMVQDGNEPVLGHPLVEGATVEGTIVKQGRDDKKIVFRYHNKTRYRKKAGHRQHFSEVKITRITAE
ncbi:MAG: 50S ribosomal protein L21 [Patescibacteria group bacterium]|nr:50S ribosomal protein L21 [Patescibacteria group bacterium]MDE2438583.1 50S ribosomal protein L21 [Patescibacteria group bacterium]